MSEKRSKEASECRWLGPDENEADTCAWSLVSSGKKLAINIDKIFMKKKDDPL